MFVCISEHGNGVILLPAPRQEPNGFNTHEQSFKKQPETVLSFGLCSQWPSASCCAPANETQWSKGMMAEQRDAGPRINKSLKWTAITKTSIDVFSFFSI